MQLMFVTMSKFQDLFLRIVQMYSFSVYHVENCPMAGLVMHGSSTVLDHVVETVQGQDALEWLAQHQGPP